MTSAAKKRYGFAPDEWDAMRERMRAVLSDVAADRQTVTYGELARVVADRRISPRSAALALLLEEVCSVEDAGRGVMLGSVVVRADSGIPGDGYFRHAEFLGREGSDRRAIWSAEVERVWDAFDPNAHG